RLACQRSRPVRSAQGIKGPGSPGPLRSRPSTTPLGGPWRSGVEGFARARGETPRWWSAAAHGRRGRCGCADLTKRESHHTPPAAPPDIASLGLAPQMQRTRGPERPPSQERRAMFSHAIILAILTHPLHVLLFWVILSRLAREVV